jgi:M6 family metalloprotease-like protein
MVAGSLSLFAAHGAAAGQDIEATARRMGRVLPPSYYERVRQQPDFFEYKNGWIARAAMSQEMAASVSGTLGVAVVLALFADSPEPPVSPQDVQRALFDGPSEFGTVTEYFNEVSGGRLNVTGETLPWVRSDLTLQEVVGDSYGLGEGARTGAFFLRALAAVDPTVDFGLFDNDGLDGIPNSGDDDGIVDAVAFQSLEVAASCGGPGIWPHRSRLDYWNGGDPVATDDRRPDGSPVLVSDYTTQSVLDCSGENVQKATTIAHELGHVLGLPDLYDRSQGILPEQRRWVVGCWSLMAAGAWGCGTTNREGWVRPTHLGPWEKERLGWLQGLEEVREVLGREYVLGPVQESEEVLKVALQQDVQSDLNEYLLIEYRTKEGFDADIPASGVLVYHIDPKVSGNQPCESCPQVYRVSLVEADGNNSLRMNFQDGGNRGEAGDAWAVTGPGRLSNSTNPSTRLHSGAESPVTVYEISVQEGEAHITLSSQAVWWPSLLQSFLGTTAPPLTPQEREYLDAQGNRNGQYDVGDLRAYLKR